MNKNPNHFDRRRFLTGAGTVLALPMLEAFAPRLAFGQTAPAPKRLLLILSQDGRLMGDGRGSNDWWSPGQVTGPLPASGPFSQLLAPLEPIRNEVVTLDGIDNLVRHTNPDGEGHIPAQKAALTCRALGPSGNVVGPSFDYVLGSRLRANPSMRPSVVISGTAADYTWRSGNVTVFFGAGGSPPTLIHPDPARAITELFGPPTPSSPPPTPSLADRLSQQRRSVLDGVLSSFNALRDRVNAADRNRLDAHADFIRSVEQRSAGGGGSPAQACRRPSESSVPPNTNPSGGAYLRGELDGVMMPPIIENLVQTFTCDVTRVASLFFWQGDDPIFPTEFPPGSSPFVSANWHTVIHGVPRIAERPQQASDLMHSYAFYARTFTQIVQRLAAVRDVDGTRLLDNTLVLWVSEMGYGSVHAAYNVPVVMAGLRSAFSRGQGRHVVSNRHSLGDLFAQVLRMFGGSDMTYGDTGTIGDYNSGNLNGGAGFPGFITPNTPLHSGPLDL